MSKKAATTIKHRLPDGQLATRVTSRACTHVVIARRDLVAMRTEAMRPDPSDREQFAHLVGQLKNVMTAAKRAEYQQSLMGARDADHFAELCAARRLGRLDKEYGFGDVGPWFVAAWCGRLELAEAEARRASKYGWIDIRVEPVSGDE